MAQAYRVEIVHGAQPKTVDSGEDEIPLTRDQRRSRRTREVRAKTTSIRRMTKREIELGKMLFPLEEHPHTMAGGPKTRAECVGGHRPCPYVSCQHNLYLDVHPRTGAIKINFPDLEPHQMVESCVLDIADRGGATLDDVGKYLNLVRESVRLLEVSAMARVIEGPLTSVLREHWDEEGPIGKRRLPVIQPSDDADELDDDEAEEDAQAEPEEGGEDGVHGPSVWSDDP